MNWCASVSNITGVTTGQIIGPEKYPNTIIILVNGHNIKLTLSGLIYLSLLIGDASICN